MNKPFAIPLVLTMLLILTACVKPETPAPTRTPATETATAAAAETETNMTEPQASIPLLSHEDFRYADIGSLVAIETFVQGVEHSREGQVSLFCQFIDGGYYLQDMDCSEEDVARLVPGTKIRATGIRSYEKGQIKLTEGSIEILHTQEAFFAEPTDVTGQLDNSNLSQLMNTLVGFKGLTVAPSIDGEGKEVAYLSDSDGETISFLLTDGKYNIPCTLSIHMIGTGPDSETYKAVKAFRIGDKVDVTGFMYWCQGPNPHIQSVTAAE